MEKNRLLWGSRRGMLELDLILMPFVEEGYPRLTADDQARYDALLEEQDQDMFTWFLGRKDPADADLLRIVEIIREHARQKAQKS